MRSAQRQLPLALASRFGWGGARPGAGRKRGARPRVRHRSRHGFRATHPCHVTLRVVDGLPSLRARPLVAAFERTVGRACERGTFRVVHYSLQRDHAHLIVEADDARSLGRGMMSIGARLARAVNRTFRRTGRVLADRYHVRPLTTPREVRNALAYVLLNVRKHRAASGGRAGGLRPGPDPASSGRWFDGWTRTLPPMASPYTARARSWLLSIGWRRHGRIDSYECPGRSRGRSRRAP